MLAALELDSRQLGDAVDERGDVVAELRAQLAAEWRAGPESWSPTAKAVFEELGLEDTGWRSLLESETFRALLVPEPLLEAA